MQFDVTVSHVVATVTPAMSRLKWLTVCCVALVKPVDPYSDYYYSGYYYDSV